MYNKIAGLKQLEKMGFPFPPYVVLNVCQHQRKSGAEGDISKKIDMLTIPEKPGHMMGITRRVSMPGDLDKLAKHGSLHIFDKDQIIREVFEKCATYGRNSKIILQHTVDAKCSGAILKEIDRVIVETIEGDAPPLLEGQVAKYETWVLFLADRVWKKERSYSCNNREISILDQFDLKLIEHYVNSLPPECYLEWSISKDSGLYFYEFLKLTHS